MAVEAGSKKTKLSSKPRHPFSTLCTHVTTVAYVSTDFHKPTTMTKRLKQIRALPSDPSSNDFLKIEYIDVNLNNSRKLIYNITNLSTTSTEATGQTEDVVESLLRLRNTRSHLSWADDLIENANDS